MPLLLCVACRSGRDRAHATFWPYPADVKYFKSMAVLSGICAFMTVAVEAYAIWFVVFAKDITDRDRYGILGRCSGGFSGFSGYCRAMLRCLHQQGMQNSQKRSHCE